MKDDRNGQRSTVNCSAYGCKMLGVYSNSTTGANNWSCWLHFRADASQLQRITADIHSNQWLGDTIRDLRTSYTTTGWPGAYRKARQAITDNDRLDLLKDSAESVWKWITRLENAMSVLCAGPVKQRPLFVIPTKEPLKRIQFDIPGVEDEAKEQAVGS